MEFDIDHEQEEDGRWIASIEKLPGVMVYGHTREEAQAEVSELAERVLLNQAI